MENEIEERKNGKSRYKFNKNIWWLILKYLIYNNFNIIKIHLFAFFLLQKINAEIVVGVW
ncbi:MAG: hypothetical protein M1538_00240 [Candidatus Marsarchaeota archaeon]|nr:hypothetical protein [Candidatus Marsarchaeota archaeon]